MAPCPIGQHYEYGSTTYDHRLKVFNYGTNTVLATGTLVVNGTSSVSAAIDQRSPITASTDPTITGTAKNTTKILIGVTDEDGNVAAQSLMSRKRHCTIEDMEGTREVEIITKITKKLLPNTHRAFLFGSRASGTNRPHSDYDLGISGPRALSLREWGELHDALEEAPIVHAVDVVDFYPASDAFKEVALQHTIPITE